MIKNDILFSLFTEYRNEKQKNKEMKSPLKQIYLIVL